ncbi:MAG: AAA family ATPase [Ardenticatenaceae bacterium]|nr:AAA family ATPase [Ardenticatenaceae bacterium]MCB9444116.1 AAA family ATPase [Ardenticatenaceae bacterium]
MPVSPLSPDKLRRVCCQDHYQFETTAELPAQTNIIGQPRGTRAIEFGIGIQSQGYNTFVLGPTGTGRATAIERFLHERTGDEPTPDDWIYVHNFTTPHMPRAISLPPGQGVQFKAQMGQLVADLQRELPQAFASEAYKEAMEAVQRDFERQQNDLLQALQVKAAEHSLGLLNTPSGFAIVPVQDGRTIPPEIYQQIPLEQRQAIEEQRQILGEELDDVLDQIQTMGGEARRQMEQIDREVAEATSQQHFDHLQKTYADHDEMLLYLSEVHQDVLENMHDFDPPAEDGSPLPDLRRYEINLLVDNSKTTGAPVIIEQDPTYHNLMGRLEYEMQDGMVTTHFTNIKCGSLHWANSGYLIINANDLLRDIEAYEALKRALKAQNINVQLRATMHNTQVFAKSLDPEPIPLKVKIILLGSPNLYYALYAQDEDFGDLFKVRSDFDSTMPRDDAHEAEYADFVATRCHEENLRHFDRSAVARVVEFGARLAEHQNKLSTRFGQIADLVREASYWAGVNGRNTTTAADVQQAINERIYRANRMEELVREQVLDETVFISTDGAVVGQVNGLSVLDTGEYAFGQPGRITARTYMGEDGVIQIERETEMSGPIHDKGVLTLVGYLGGKYAQNQPLSLTASLTFEQNYGGIDGDSASSTELYALLSSLGNIPIKQGIAVTGSVNQRGEVQPIGGVNEKVEGFFHICQARGLTGEQGVMIPASNVAHLMLAEEVVTAVTQKQFHIWPIRTIDEGIELLTSIPAGEQAENGIYPEGTIHHAVQDRLLQLAEDLKAFGNGDDS